MCINPLKGMDGGDTWDYRRGYVEGARESTERTLKEMKKRLEDY